MFTNDIIFLSNSAKYIVCLTIALFFHSHTIYADVPKTTTGALPPLFPGGTKKIIVKEMGASGGEGGSHKMGRVVALVLFIVAVAVFMFISSRRRRRSAAASGKGAVADSSQIARKESVYKAEEPPSAMRPPKIPTAAVSATKKCV